jgi:hypothetical protein
MEGKVTPMVTELAQKGRKAEKRRGVKIKGDIAN